MLLTIVSAYYGNPNKLVDITTQVQNLVTSTGDAKATIPIYIWPSTFNIPDPDQSVVKGLTICYKYGTSPSAEILTISGNDGQTLQLNTFPLIGTVVVNRAIYSTNGVSIDISASTLKTIKYFGNFAIFTVGSTDFYNYYCGGKTIQKGTNLGIFYLDYTITNGSTNEHFIIQGVDGQTINLKTMNPISTQ